MKKKETEKETPLKIEVKKLPNGKKVTIISNDKPADTESKDEVGTFLKPAHLVNQTLKYKYPKDGQLNIFESLQECTQYDLTSDNVDRDFLVVGIKLSATEQKLIDALSLLLHIRSETSDRSSDNYYTGEGYSLVHYGGDEGGKAKSPEMTFTLYELTQAYKGDKQVSGKEVENVYTILIELSKKKFLMKYEEKKWMKDGGSVVKTIELYKELFDLPHIKLVRYNKDLEEVSRKEAILVQLNPIFARHIDRYYVKYPVNITERTMSAHKKVNGGTRISDGTMRLREYLINELSHKRYFPEIMEERLHYRLYGGWMEKGRKKLTQEYTQKSIVTMIHMGLLLCVEPTTGADGSPMIKFLINPDWK